MSIVIEFVGFAGVGKTFISKQLADKLNGESILNSDVNVNLYDVIHYSIRKPKLILYAIMFVISTRQKFIIRNVIYFKNILIYKIKLEKLLKMNKKYVIIDEGIIHKFRMIRSTSKIEKLTYSRIRKTHRISLFSGADVVVFVTASLRNIAIRRLLRRRKKIENESEIEREINKIKTKFTVRSCYTENDILSAQNDHHFYYIKLYNDDKISIDELIDKINNNTV
jgi:cytidylate kinase